MQRRWLKIAAVVVAALVVAVLLVPFLVNADTFRPTLQTQLSRAIGRPITLGHLSFSLLKGSLVAENIAIADDPAFSNEPFLQARSLSIGVEVAPLLLHRQVRITRIAADGPAIRLIHAADGKWNFSSIGGPAANQKPAQESAIPDLTVAELAIKDGSATVASGGKQTVYTGIDLTLRQFSFLKSFPFELAAKFPGNGTLSLKGEAGPISAKDAADTPFRATLAIKQLDPVASGFVDAAQGIAGLLDIDAQAASDGATLTSNGTVTATHLKLARAGAPSNKPVQIRYTVSNNLDARTGQLSDLSVQTGAVAVRVAGSFRLTATSPVLDLRLSAPGIPVDALEDLLPTVGVRLPPGSQLRGGTVNASLSITGAANAPVIAGPVSVDNTQLAGFDIGSKIQGAKLFGGSGGGSQIQTLRATLRSTPQGTQFSDIYANLPQLGTATGAGSVSPAGALDFKLNAKLNNSNPVGAMTNQALNTLGSFTSLFHSRGRQVKPPTSNNGVPLTVTGTTSAPSIRANVGALLR